MNGLTDFIGSAVISSRKGFGLLENSFSHQRGVPLNFFVSNVAVY